MILDRFENLVTANQLQADWWLVMENVVDGGVHSDLTSLECFRTFLIRFFIQSIVFYKLLHKFSTVFEIKICLIAPLRPNLYDIFQWSFQLENFLDFYSWINEIFLVIDHLLLPFDSLQLVLWHKVFESKAKFVIDVNLLTFRDSYQCLL